MCFPQATGILVLTEHEPNRLNGLNTALEKLILKRGPYQHPSNAYFYIKSVFLCPNRT